eukprot:7795086-Lingulodinium_polyedra.AAC.1
MPEHVTTSRVFSEVGEACVLQAQGLRQDRGAACQAARCRVRPVAGGRFGFAARRSRADPHLAPA